MTNGITLVLGGTGKTGRRIVERLTRLNQAVRVGSRAGHPPFDWTYPGSWHEAVRGVESAYISFYPDLAVPGAAETIEWFTQVAVKHGVRKLVLLSGRGESEAELCEEMVRRSGVPWTILRSSWFSQNFSEGFLLDSIRAGEMALPVGDVGEPFVDADDIADVAVAALTGPQHDGQLYEMTGPRLWTFAGAVAEIAAASGRDIGFRHITHAEYEASLVRAVPPEFVKLVMYLFTNVLDGRNAMVADGVQRALNRPPRDFAAFVRDTAASGIWSDQQMGLRRQGLLY